MADNTYSVDVKCWNCNYDGPVDIPKGRPPNFWGFGEVDVCPRCFCDELHKKMTIPTRRFMFGW